MNNADKLLRGIVGFVVLVFAVVCIWLAISLGSANERARRADAKVDALHTYLLEVAPAVRARHQELCGRIDSLAGLTKNQKFGCRGAEVPKSPPDTLIK